MVTTATWRGTTRGSVAKAPVWIGRLARFGLACRGLVYLALAATALSIGLGRPAGPNSDAKTVDWTARVMRHTFGRPLVAAVGAAVCIAGFVLISKAFHRSYDVGVRIDDVPPSARRSFEALGMAGMVARGVIVTLIGYFIIQAAVTFNPTRAKGLDGVLASMVHRPYGPWLLLALAAGLACFGCFSLLEARYARD